MKSILDEFFSLYLQNAKYDPESETAKMSETIEHKLGKDVYMGIEEYISRSNVENEYLGFTGGFKCAIRLIAECMI